MSQDDKRREIKKAEGKLDLLIAKRQELSVNIGAFRKLARNSLQLHFKFEESMHEFEAMVTTVKALDEARKSDLERRQKATQKQSE